MRSRVVLVGVFLAVTMLKPPVLAGASNGGADSPACDSSDEEVRREAGLDVLALIPGAYDQECLFRTDFDTRTTPCSHREPAWCSRSCDAPPTTTVSSWT